MARDGTVAPKERINIRYKSDRGGGKESIELPFKMMVVGDFTQKPDERPVEDRKPININQENFDDVLRSHEVQVDMGVKNCLSDDPAAVMNVSLKFSAIEDFEPASIARQVPELSKLLELREALVSLKGPLGNVPAFRKAIESMLTDEENRKKILDELKISE